MMAPQSWRRYRLALLLLLLGVGWFLGLHLIDLRGEEPRRALVAWEMLKSGNWYQPTIQGQPYYNKPPLFNWLIAGFYGLLGTTESWVVRLPSLLAYVIWGYLNFRVVKAYVDRETALWSTLFFFTAVHYLFFGTVLAGELDLLYGLIVYGQGIVLFHFYRRHAWLKMFLASYLLVSLGFMTKGLPSVAYQAFTLLGLAIWGRYVIGTSSGVLNKETVGSSKVTVQRQPWYRWLLSPAHLVGAFVGLLPVFLYFYGYERRYGNGGLYFFNLIEEASQKSVAEGHPLDILLHLIELPFQFFTDHLPWSLLLVYGLWKGWHKVAFKHAFLRYCVLFFGVNVLLYWVSPGSRIRYFYGLVPFLLTILAYWSVKYRPVKQQWLWSIFFVLAVARIGYNYLVLPYQQRTTGTIQLYRQITDDALQYAQGKDLYTCCEADTIYVDPSVAGVALLRDTIIIPMYTPYQIPLYLQRERDRWLPFVHRPDQPGIYLSSDTLAGTLLEQYRVWDDKTLYLFEVEE